MELLKACQQGDVDKVRVLLRKLDGSFVDKKGRNAVFAAVEGGSAECLHELASSGSGVDWRLCDKSGDSALIAAVKSADSSVVEALLKCGKVELLQCDAEQLTALHWAVKLSADDTIQTLLANEATRSQLLRAKGGQRGAPPLHWALSSEDTLRTLLQLGASLDDTDAEGRTAALSAAQYCADALPLLAKLGADLRARDNKQRNLLHLAVLGDESLASHVKQDVLVAMCAEQDAEGNLPLHLAAMLGSDQYDELNNLGGGADKPNAQGQTPAQLKEQRDRNVAQQEEEAMQALLAKEQEGKGKEEAEADEKREAVMAKLNKMKAKSEQAKAEARRAKAEARLAKELEAAEGGGGGGGGGRRGRGGDDDDEGDEEDEPAPVKAAPKRREPVVEQPVKQKGGGASKHQRSAPASNENEEQQVLAADTQTSSRGAKIFFVALLVGILLLGVVLNIQKKK